MCQFHSKMFVVRTVSAVRQSTVTDYLRGSEMTRRYDMLLLRPKWLDYRDIFEAGY